MVFPRRTLNGARALFLSFGSWSFATTTLALFSTTKLNVFESYCNGGCSTCHMVTKTYISKILARVGETWCLYMSQARGAVVVNIQQGLKMEGFKYERCCICLKQNPTSRDILPPRRLPNATGMRATIKWRTAFVFSLRSISWNWPPFNVDRDLPSDNQNTRVRAMTFVRICQRQPPDDLAGSIGNRGIKPARP